MDKQMSLEQVRDWHAQLVKSSPSDAVAGLHYQMADAIDAELKAREEAAAWCCPDDPHNSTAFSWPGTARVLSRHTMPLYAAPPVPKIEVTDAVVSNLAWWLAQRDGEDAGLHFYEDSAREMLEAALKETP